MSLTKPRFRGSIVFPDGVLSSIKDGVVLISGSSPTAKVTILDFDASDRGQQVDVLREATIEEAPDKLIINGRSMHSAVQQKLSGKDQIVTVRVDLKRCQDCR